MTAHDGFSLQDLVSYESKHNEANLDENRDGTDENFSWNCGIEGPTDDPGIVALREQQKRNMVATLFLSQGVPMLFGGDELSHSQNGNNNTYCQDNDLTWLDWQLDDRRSRFLDFVRLCARTWADHPVLHRRKFFLGRHLRGTNMKDISFLEPSGREMEDDAWANPNVQAMAIHLLGNTTDTDEFGNLIIGDNLLVFLNSHWERLDFNFPVKRSAWKILFDTSEKREIGSIIPSNQPFACEGRSVVLFHSPQTETSNEQPS